MTRLRNASPQSRQSNNSILAVAPPLSRSKCAICSNRLLRPPPLEASRLPTSRVTCLPSPHFVRWSFEEEGSKRRQPRPEALDLEKVIPLAFAFSCTGFPKLVREFTINACESGRWGFWIGGT